MNSSFWCHRPGSECFDLSLNEFMCRGEINVSRREKCVWETFSLLKESVTTVAKKKLFSGWAPPIQIQWCSIFDCVRSHEWNDFQGRGWRNTIGRSDFLDRIYFVCQTVATGPASEGKLILQLISFCGFTTPFVTHFYYCYYFCCPRVEINNHRRSLTTHFYKLFKFTRSSFY